MQGTLTRIPDARSYNNWEAEEVILFFSTSLRHEYSNTEMYQHVLLKPSLQQTFSIV